MAEPSYLLQLYGPSAHQAHAAIVGTRAALELLRAYLDDLLESPAHLPSLAGGPLYTQAGGAGYALFIHLKTPGEMDSARGPSAADG